jgi:hypothetical protein
MPDFDYWFENIVSTCDLIASPSALTQAWINKDKSITSAYDLDELLEQLLGDLHLEEHIRLFEDALRKAGAFDAIEAFTRALLEVKSTARSGLHEWKPEEVLTSPAWEALQQKARIIIQLPAAKPYTRGLTA